MNKKILVTGIFLIFLINSANSAQIGVVVEFPDKSIVKKCVVTAENASGYEVMQSTGLNIEWSAPSQYGHALCKINGVGDDASGTACAWGSNYWGFYIKEFNDENWTYSPVGHDGGSDCWNGDFISYDGHYCARDKDMLGYAYGEYGTIPMLYNFRNVCLTGDADNDGLVDDFELLNYIDNWAKGIVSDFDVLDSIDAWARS